MITALAYCTEGLHYSALISYCKPMHALWCLIIHMYWFILPSSPSFFSVACLKIGGSGMRYHSDNIMCRRCLNDQVPRWQRSQTSRLRYDEQSLVPFIYISDTNDGCKHIAQTHSQYGLPTHAQLNCSYGTSISGIKCVTSHTGPFHFSASNTKKLEVACGWG